MRMLSHKETAPGKELDNSHTNLVLAVVVLVVVLESRYEKTRWSVHAATTPSSPTHPGFHLPPSRARLLLDEFDQRPRDQQLGLPVPQSGRSSRRGPALWNVPPRDRYGPRPRS
jgi:hypothetical protein